ncbi:MAG: glycerophosphodiester phosphodiesterase family protein, partial [Acidimicrobiales bacterium]
GEPIATMEELLDAFPDARLNIDPKMDRAVEPLVEALRRTNAWDRVNVAAFSDPRLLQLRRLAGRPVCTAMGPIAIGRLRLASYGVPPGPFAAACCQVPMRYRRAPLIDARFVKAARRYGIPIHVWTIDEPDEINRLLDLGVGGIFTDRPTVLKEVLIGRGQWAE